MFKLTLHDRNGTELKLGDIVKISIRNEFTFFCEVTYLTDLKVIAPFYTFSFHSFEKVDSLPPNAIKSNETRYNIWYLENPEEDGQAEKFNNYLMSWRECEHRIEERCYRIELIESQVNMFETKQG